MAGSDGGDGQSVREREGEMCPALNVALITAPHVGALGIRAAIEQLPDLRLVGEAEPGDGAVRLVAEHQPGHAIVAGDGVTDQLLGVLRAVRGASPETKLLVCTNRFDPALMLSLINLPAEAILAWAEVTPAALRAALEAATAGKTYYSAPVTQAVLDASVRAPSILRRRIGLTERQLAVLRAVVETGTQQEAARRLNISERTLQAILLQVKRKLGADALPMLGAWAHALGLVDPTERPE